MSDTVSFLVYMAWAIFGVSRPMTAPIAVVRPPVFPLYESATAALHDVFGDEPIEVLAIGQRWTANVPPRAVIAIGNDAARHVESRWPAVPRASILQSPANPLSTSQTLQRDLVIGSHTEHRCTSDALTRLDPPVTTPTHFPQYIVIADGYDNEAKSLAVILKAELLQGTAAQVMAKLRRIKVNTPHRIWVRSSPELSIRRWIEFLSHMNKLPLVDIGSDSPGWTRLGIPQWVEPDLQRMAVDVKKWADKLPRFSRHSSNPPKAPIRKNLQCITLHN